MPELTPQREPNIIRSPESALHDDLQFLANWERAPSASPAAMLRIRQLRRAQQAAAANPTSS